MIHVGTRPPGLLGRLRAQVAAVIARRKPDPQPGAWRVVHNGAFRPADLAVIAVALARRGVVPAEHIRPDLELGAHLALDGLDRMIIAIDLEERLAVVGHLDTTGWVTVADVVSSVAAAARNEF